MAVGHNTGVRYKDQENRGLKSQRRHNEKSFKKFPNGVYSLTDNFEKFISKFISG